MNQSHGYSDTPIFKMWASMKRSKGFPARWKKFENFLDDLGDQPSENHVLRRKESKEPHSKDNTYWTIPNSQKKIEAEDSNDPVPYTLNLPQYVMNNLQKLANQFGCVAERGRYSGEPSVLKFIREIGEGEFIIKRKEK